MGLGRIPSQGQERVKKMAEEFAFSRPGQLNNAHNGPAPIFPFIAIR